MEEPSMESCETLEKMLRMSEGDRERAGRLLARSFFKILRRNGFSHAQVMAVAGSILDEVMKDVRANGKDREPPLEIRVARTRSEVA